MKILKSILLFFCASLIGVQTASAAVKLSVKDFGAVGDGKTNDTKAIVKALKSLKTGGELRFEKGEYIFSGLLKINGLKNCTIDARGAVLKNDQNNGSFHFNKCQNITWLGGELTYVNFPKKTNTKKQHPFYFTRCKNLRVQGVNINGSPFMGMAINACNFVWVENCKVENTMRDGIHFVHCQDIVCSGNIIRNTIDDALAFIDYGADIYQRLERGIVSNNIIYNCRQGLVCLGGSDFIFANNHVEKTVFSGCQITTNDRFNLEGSTIAERIKVIGNRFIESGGSMKLRPGLKRDPVTPSLVDSLGRTKNTGQLTTGKAAIVVSYIDRKKGWNRNGDTYFTKDSIKVKKVADNKVVVSGGQTRMFFPGRVLKVVGKKTGEKVCKVIKAVYKNGQIELSLGPGVTIVDDAVALKPSRILTDIEIIDNEILYSHVDGIYTNSVYRLRVCGNKIYNCNSDNSQFTGVIVRILNGAYVDFVNNWIIEDRTKKRHKKPLIITAKKCRELGTRID